VTQALDALFVASTGEVGTPNFKLTGYASHPARITVTWCE